MGRNQESITITARLSAHNDERDEVDEALWSELQTRIAAILQDQRYEDITPMIT